LFTSNTLKCRFFPFWEIVETTQKGSSGIAVREIW
jgi:hypothetical protein